MIALGSFTADDFEQAMVLFEGIVERHRVHGGSVETIAVILKEQPDGRVLGAVGTRTTFVEGTRQRSEQIAGRMAGELSNSPPDLLPVYLIPADGTPGLVWINYGAPLNSPGGAA